MSFMKSDKLPTQEESLPGRSDVMKVSNRHYVSGRSYMPPFPSGLETLVVGMGCFWGAERLFWKLDGVFSTAVGYAGGFTPNPNYDEVCSGGTAHAEVVLVIFDPQVISIRELLRVFWESHNPSAGMRQGNDRGTQYRSAIYTNNEMQLTEARFGAQRFNELLMQNNFGEITTEIKMLDNFYYAEDHHQQYLAKHPLGYCGIAGLGLQCPV
jgi:peptide-methionine (S)-S-oxide reductase